MGCHCTKLTSIIDNNTTKSKQKSEEEILGLLRELNIKTSVDNSPGLKKSVLNDQTLLVLLKEEISNTIATLKVLALLKTLLSKGDMEFSALQALHHQLASLCIRQKSMFGKLRAKKAQIREKTSSTTWQKKLCKVMWNVIFVAALVGSVALAAITAPHFAVSAAMAGGSVIKSAEQWSDSVWNDALSMLEEEEEVVKVMGKGAFVGVYETESLRAMVKRLEITVEAIIGNAEFAIEPQAAMEMVMEEMKRRTEEGGKLIKELVEKVEVCDKEISKLITHLVEVVTDN